MYKDNATWMSAAYRKVPITERGKAIHTRRSRSAGSKEAHQARTLQTWFTQDEVTTLARGLCGQWAAKLKSRAICICMARFVLDLPKVEPPIDDPFASKQGNCVSSPS